VGAVAPVPEIENSFAHGWFHDILPKKMKHC
jgi:hypothetical protein